MGATWHTKSMFDLDTSEESFSDLLQSKNLETYAFDIFGLEPNQFPDKINDQHLLNIDYAVDLVEKYNIEYIMGYSYGCLLAGAVSKRTKIKGLILLDPYATTTVSKTYPGNGRIAIDKTSIKRALVDNDTNIEPVIVNDYLHSLCTGDVLISPWYPVSACNREQQQFLQTENIESLMKFSKVKVFCTKQVPDNVKNLFPKEIMVEYPDASHWILLEKYRYQLADDVDKFITSML